MPLLKTPAIVLKSRKWGDADRIVTFFTLKHGKVRGVARGARRMKSRFGGTLEPFVYCDLVLYEKPGDTLYRVSQTDVRQAFHPLRNSLETIAGAARLANLARAVTADGDAVPRVFHALLEGFRAIQGSEDPSLTAALYELEILRFAGYLPHLDRCNVCQGRASGGAWFFSPRAGGTVCTACVKREPARCPAVSPACLAFFRQALRMDPVRLPRLKASASLRNELREVIELYVDNVAGRRMPRAHAMLGEGRVAGEIAAERPTPYGQAVTS
ncbi:MAG: DNA repair protein RecO [Nitrospirae bacterium]|nr:MAG: DNA repair protein RecO [Nitrospirota bacterium]